jgi:phosphoribosylaminoimidazolecarboxamide formyltransferase/IMP cyclohydrolase
MIASWFAFADQGEPSRIRSTFRSAAPSRCATARIRTSQAALLSAAMPVPRPASARREQVQGKELSYNNYNDADAALELVSEFRDGPPTVVIVKHANPCGVATGATLLEAYAGRLRLRHGIGVRRHHRGQPPLDARPPEAIAGIFTEVVVAPDADDEALAIFAAKKNLRLLLTGALPNPARPGMMLKSITGGWLVQSRDNGKVDAISRS